MIEIVYSNTTNFPPRASSASSASWVSPSIPFTAMASAYRHARRLPRGKGRSTARAQSPDPADRESREDPVRNWWVVGAIRADRDWSPDRDPVDTDEAPSEVPARADGELGVDIPRVVSCLGMRLVQVLRHRASVEAGA